MNTSIINTNSNTKIFSTNNINKIEVNNENIIESNSDVREVLPKGYLLSQINLSTIPSVIADAINQAMIDTKNATLSDTLIDTLRTSLQNLDDGIYKKTYIDNTITYLENLLTSKVNLETVASIADSKLAVALQDYASTSQVELLQGRVGSSESEITNIKETINTNDTARATQIEELEASIEDTFAGYSDAIDLYVDSDGNVKSEKIEKLELGNYIQKVSINEENKIELDELGNYTAISSKVILNSDGKIVGFKFTDTNDLATFKINTDVFEISNSTNSYTPFRIEDNNLIFNGKVTFTNITGGENIVTINNVQDAINNNVTTIDGGKIVTNEVFVNNLNAVGGIIAENISASEIVGKTITGGVINGARINGAVIKASYLDLNGDLEVLTNYIITVAMYNANPSLYTDAVYISADNQYRIPSLSVVREETRNQTLSSTGATFQSKIRSYNCANAGHNLKCVKIRPSVYIGGVSATISMDRFRNTWTSSPTVEIYLGNYYLGRVRFENMLVTSGGADWNPPTYTFIKVYFNDAEIYQYETTNNTSPSLNTTINVGGVILRIIANSFTSVSFSIVDGSYELVSNFTNTTKSLIEIRNSNQPNYNDGWGLVNANIVASVNSATYINNMI